MLKVRAEETTDGLWDGDGQMVFREELALSASTRNRLLKWSEWHEDYESYLPATHRTPPPFPMEAFNAEGRAIAALIQGELPDWQVVYVDEW